MISSIFIQEREVEAGIHVLAKGLVEKVLVEGEIDSIVQKIQELELPCIGKIGSTAMFTVPGSKNLFIAKGYYSGFHMFLAEGGWENVYKFTRDFQGLKEKDILQILGDFTLKGKLDLLVKAGESGKYDFAEIVKKTILEGIGQ